MLDTNERVQSMRRFDALCTTLLASAILAGSAIASTSLAPATSPSQVVAGAVANSVAPEAVQIEGYRSAKFGMPEVSVRKAIKSDFAVENPTHLYNELEHTNALIIANQVLIPNTPPATVTYILGAASSKLIQVNIIWGGDTGADIKLILLAANTLTTYFVERGRYIKESYLVNQALENGSGIAFRGADQKGRMILLQMTPIIQDKNEIQDNKQTQPTKAMLRLSYMENPISPDIFRIEKGKF